MPDNPKECRMHAARCAELATAARTKLAQPRVQHNLSQISVSQRWGAVQAIPSQVNVCCNAQSARVSQLMATRQLLLVAYLILDVLRGVDCIV
jgi:hypothetical protein